MEGPTSESLVKPASLSRQRIPIATFHACFLWALWNYWAAHDFIAWRRICDMTHRWPMTQSVCLCKKETMHALLGAAIYMLGRECEQVHENMHSFLHYSFHPHCGLEWFMYEFCLHFIPAQWNMLVPSVVQHGMWLTAVPTASNLHLFLIRVLWQQPPSISVRCSIAWPKS